MISAFLEIGELIFRPITLTSRESFDIDFPNLYENDVNCFAFYFIILNKK
jgi:hypothetical protein